MTQINIYCKDHCPDCRKDVKPEDQALACEMVLHLLSGNGRYCRRLFDTENTKATVFIKYVMSKLSGYT